MFVMQIENKQGLLHLYKEAVLLLAVSFGCWLAASLNNSFSAGLSFAGYLGFGVFEYCLHRYIFHHRSKTKWIKQAVYRIHGIHHSYPEDQKYYKTSPFTKTLASLCVGLVLFSIFSFQSLNLSAGFTLGYLQYLGVHFIIHHYQSPGNIFKELWLNHDIHHHINPTVAYGISNPIWDIIFCTFPDIRDYQKLKLFRSQVK